MESSIPHTRPEPEAWPELLDYAREIAPGCSAPFYSQILHLVKRVGELSDSELTQNAYYSYGKTMCGIAQRLQTPEVRKEVVTKMALGMVIGAEKQRNLPADELYKPVTADLDNRSPISAAFSKITGEAWKELKPEVKLVSKVLAATDFYRVKIAQTSDPGTMLGKAKRRLEPYAISFLTYPALPRWFITAASTAGAGGVWRLRLSGNGPHPFEPKHNTISIEMEQVNKIAKAVNFAPHARLRLDEFITVVGWKDGTPPTFDRSVLKQPPAQEMLTEPARILHNRFERYGCEALYTGRLAVDVAVDLFPAAIEQAMTMTPRHARRLHKAFRAAEYS